MINRVIMAGRLGSDPEVKKTQSGVSIATLSIATERPYKNKNTNEYDVDFHDWRFYRETADAISRYLRKGDLVTAEGYAQKDSWTSNDGLKHSREVFVGERIQFPPRQRQTREETTIDNDFNTGNVNVVDSDDLPF